MKTKKKVQVLNFLDVKTILHEDNLVVTKIYYKQTNTQDNVIVHTLIIPKILFLKTLLKEL